MFQPGITRPAYDAKDEGDGRRNVVPPPIVRVTVNASQKWFDAVGDNRDQFASAIINNNGGAIAQFYNSQYHNYQLGVASVQSTTQRLPQIDMRLDIVQDTPILALTVYPENSQTAKTELYIDLNNDGYMAWLHNEGNYPNNVNGLDSISGPYDIFLNGYLVLSGVKITRVNSLFVIMFGPTALRLRSLHDQDNPLNNPPTSSLFPPVTPARKDIEASVGVNGVPIPKHKDLPGYFVFNWGDQLNPGLFSYNRNFSQSWDQLTASEATPDSGPVQAAIIQGVHFASAEKSPLNVDGPNVLTIQLSADGTAAQTSYYQSFNLLLAEFYDRRALRAAQTTPKYPTPVPGGQVLTNDTPLVWAGGTSGATLDGQPSVGVNAAASLRVDLTPAKAYPSAATLGDPTNEITYVPPTPEMQDIWSAYGVVAAAYATASNTWFSNLQSSLHAYYTASNAYAGAQPSLNTLRNQTTNIDNLINQSQAAAHTANLAAGVFQGNPNSANGAAWQAAALASNSADNALWNANYALSGIDQAYWYNLINLNNAYYATIAPYIAAAQNQPVAPPVPNFSAVGAPGIDSFKYRTFTVQAGQFSFGPWQGAQT